MGGILPRIMLLSINRYFLCALVVLICKRTDPTITVCCTPVVCSILVVVANTFKFKGLYWVEVPEVLLFTLEKSESL